MKAFLGGISYSVLIPAAILLGLAPFFPLPHVVEKLRMLASGTLHKPIDIFDLLMHLSLVILLLCKGLADLFDKSRQSKE